MQNIGNTINNQMNSNTTENINLIPTKKGNKKNLDIFSQKNNKSKNIDIEMKEDQKI